MNLLDIAFKSLKRQKLKKLFLVIALILGSSTVISLFTFVNTQSRKIETQFDEYGANIIITPKTDHLSLSYGGIHVGGITTNLKELKISNIVKIKDIPNKKNIRSVSPKIIGIAELNYLNAQHAILIVGVDFEEEIKIKSWWEITGRYPEKKNEIIIGADAAEKLKLHNNSMVRISNKEFLISGILKTTGSRDDSIILGDFETVSTLLNKQNDVTMVEVSALCSDCPIDEIIRQIRTVLPEADVKGVKQIMQQKMNTVNQFKKFSISITIIIIMIGIILVFTSMIGAVIERKHEIGIFRAIGFKQRHIMTIIMTESLIISMIAAALGIIIGLIISYYILPGFTDIEQSMVAFTPLMYVVAAVSVIFISLISTIYPAFKAAKVDPVKTMNSL
ncbi:MAG: FtsX-like permease family protein [Spirochaetes bacterium]|nr:FtsX-like permease family protein [Spirochaetota bacterium]